eukprot:3110722-Pleurochrysis_carterae.AAC.1
MITSRREKKSPRRQGLGEEVGEIVRAVDERHRDVMLFDALADEEMPAVYMFGALVVLRVVR